VKGTALVPVAVIALLLAACGGSSKAPTTRTGTSSVARLRNMEQLRTAFNAHTSMPRLLVLISPT
jgi:hypothetical protein